MDFEVHYPAEPPVVSVFDRLCVVQGVAFKCNNRGEKIKNSWQREKTKKLYGLKQQRKDFREGENKESGLIIETGRRKWHKLTIN